MRYTEPALWAILRQAKAAGVETTGQYQRWREQMRQAGRAIPTLHALYRRFGTWQAVRAFRDGPAPTAALSPFQAAEQLGRAWWRHNGVPPTAKEWDRHPDKPCTSLWLRRRMGSWRQWLRHLQSVDPTLQWPVPAVRVTTDRQATVMALLAHGATYEAVGKLLGVSRQRVGQLVRQWHHPPRKHGRPRKDRPIKIP